MVKSINFLVLIIIALFAVSCEKDKGLIPTGENQESVANTIFLDGEKGSSDEFSRAVEAALEDSSGIELDWSRESVKPFTRANKILVVPVKNSSDYVMFYKEKGKILYKYLHPLQGQDEDKIFEEMTFQVVNDSKELGIIGQFAGKAAEKIAKIEVRTPDPPCGCEGSGFGDWLSNTWQDFGSWLGELGGAIGNLFNTLSDGRYGGTSSNYYSSNGPSGSFTVGTYGGIPNDNIGIKYEGGYAKIYNNLGELFNYDNKILLDVIPNLSSGGGSKSQWLLDNRDVLINIHFYIDAYGDTKEAKQAADEYYRLMRYDNQFASEGINPGYYEPEEFLAAVTIYEEFVDEVGEDPTDPYQWQLAMEVFRDELLPLGLEFVPVIGDMIGSYNDFQSGNYFLGSVGLLAAIAPGDEVLKVINKADDIRDAWKTVKAFYRVWHNIANLSGTQKVFNKMPQSWKNLPGSKLANNNKGLRWQKTSSHHFRLSEALSGGWPSQQVPYARFFKNGAYLDKFGNPIQSNNPNFQELTHIPISDLTDSFLYTFFN